ncbi:MAG: integrin alpha [Phycisphaerales bacterium]
MMGDEPNDLFGWSILPVGDMDSDGVPDVLISAPNYDGGHGGLGKVSLYSSLDGTQIWSSRSVIGGTFSIGAGDPARAGVAAGRPSALVRVYLDDAVLGGSYWWQQLDLLDGSLIDVGLEEELTHPRMERTARRIAPDRACRADRRSRC